MNKPVKVFIAVVLGLLTVYSLWAVLSLIAWLSQNDGYMLIPVVALLYAVYLFLVGYIVYVVFFKKPESK